MDSVVPFLAQSAWFLQGQLTDILWLAATRNLRAILTALTWRECLQIQLTRIRQKACDGRQQGGRKTVQIWTA
jgi:hypothetical protein